MALTGQAGVERVCALKILKEVRAGRDAEELTQRFLDEAKVVTKLSHENLVYVFDFGIHDRRGYLAMEYVQGKSVTETWNRCAARRDGFPIGLSLYYIAELVSALWYAANVEGLGLVHRDISPSNILLSYAGEVKLSDFGVAKRNNDHSMVTSLKGELGYISPEQARGAPTDRRQAGRSPQRSLLRRGDTVGAAHRPSDVSAFGAAAADRDGCAALAAHARREPGT